jgi:hypothetical protein
MTRKPFKHSPYLQRLSHSNLLHSVPFSNHRPNSSLLNTNTTIRTNCSSPRVSSTLDLNNNNRNQNQMNQSPTNNRQNLHLEFEKQGNRPNSVPSNR